MGRSVGKQQLRGALVASIACSLLATTPVAAAQGIQIALPVAGVSVDVSIGATAPAPPDVPPAPAPSEPTPGPPAVPAGDDAAVTIVAAPAPPPVPAADSPQAPSDGHDGTVAATSSATPSSGAAASPSSDRVTAEPLPATPATHEHARSAEAPHAHAGDTSGGTERRDIGRSTGLGVHVPTGATPPLVDAAPSGDHAPRFAAVGVAPGQEDPPMRATSEPVRAPSASASSGSAPAGIVPPSEAPAANLPSAVVDEAEHPLRSRRQVLRIERPG